MKKILVVFAAVLVLGMKACPDPSPTPGPSPTATPVLTPTPSPTAEPTPVPSPTPEMPLVVSSAAADGSRAEAQSQEPHLIRQLAGRVNATYLGPYECMTNFGETTLAKALQDMGPYLSQSQNLGLMVVAPLMPSWQDPQPSGPSLLSRPCVVVETSHSARVVCAGEGLRTFGASFEDPNLLPQLVVYKAAGVWSRVPVVMLGDEEPWQKEEVESRIRGLEAYEDSLGLPRKCVGITLTSKQIQEGTAHLAENLCRVYIEAYAPLPDSYWPAENETGLYALLEDLVARIPSDKEIGVWRQGYNRNGAWKGEETLAHLQWSTTKWIQAHRPRVKEDRTFAFVRKNPDGSWGGTYGNPNLVSQQQRAWGYYTSNGTTDPGPQPPGVAGKVVSIDISPRYKVGPGNHPALQNPVRGGIVLFIAQPKDKAGVVAKANTPVLPMWATEWDFGVCGKQMAMRPDASGPKPKVIITGENEYASFEQTSEGHDGNYFSSFGLGPVLRLSESAPVGCRVSAQVTIRGVNSGVLLTTPVVEE